LRRLLLKLGLLAPIALLVAATNWFVDPALFFGSTYADPSRRTYEAEIFNDMQRGRVHRLRGAIAQRALTEMLAASRPDIEVIRLGSSVSKPVNSDLFPGRRFLNAGIFGARLERVVAAYQIYHEQGLRPKTVILFLSNAYLTTTQAAAEFQAEYCRARVRLGLADPNTNCNASGAPQLFAAASFRDELLESPGPLHPYDKLISPRYFQMSLKLLEQDWITGNPEAGIGPALPEDEQGSLYPDGSVTWSPVDQQRTPAGIRARSQMLLTPSTLAGVDPLEGGLIPEQCELFEHLVDDLIQQGVQVEIVLPPHNPWFYGEARRVLDRDGRLMRAEETEAYVRKYAASRGIVVRGSFDGARVGFTESDFVDYCHIRRESIGRLWRPEAVRPGPPSQ
jgi:hypothetical protein